MREGATKKNVLKRGDVAVATLIPALRSALDDVDGSERSREHAARSITRILRPVDATLSEPRVLRALASVVTDSNRAKAAGRVRTKTSRATVVKLLDALGLRGNYADRVERKLRAIEKADRAVGRLVAKDLEIISAGVLPSPRAVTEYVDALFGTKRQRSGGEARRRR